MGKGDSIAPVREVASDYLIAVMIATEVPPRPQVGRDESGSLIYWNEPSIDTALVAIANVVLNRTKDSQFPDTPLAVVMQPKQFSTVCREDYWRRALDGEWFPDHVERAYQTWVKVKDGIDIFDPAPGALYYYSPISMVPKWSAPSWASRLSEIKTLPLSMHISPTYFRFFR